MMIGAFEQLHNREKEKKTLLLSNIYNSLSHLKITLNNDIFYLENSHCNSLHFNLNSSILFNFFKINIIKMLLEETMTSFLFHQSDRAEINLKKKNRMALVILKNLMLPW